MSTKTGPSNTRPTCHPMPRWVSPCHQMQQPTVASMQSRDCKLQLGMRAPGMSSMPGTLPQQTVAAHDVSIAYGIPGLELPRHAPSCTTMHRQHAESTRCRTAACDLHLEWQSQMASRHHARKGWPNIDLHLRCCMLRQHDSWCTQHAAHIAFTGAHAAHKHEPQRYSFAGISMPHPACACTDHVTAAAPCWHQAACASVFSLYLYLTLPSKVQGCNR